MAKKQSGIDNPLKPTEPKRDEPEKLDPVKAFGIGLKESEWQHLEEIAGDLNSTRHALAAWAIRDFIKRYERGDIKPVKQETLPGL